MKLLQDEVELKAFITLLQQEGVRSYLEIGSKFGGSLLDIGVNLPKGSRIVCVDLPGNDDSRMRLTEAGAALKRQDYDAHLFFGDSTDDRIVSAVKSLGPFDACFIDANHTEKYVRRDWDNYGPLARIVAFHDISWDRVVQQGRLPIEVPKVWNEIKIMYRHVEIRHSVGQNGIGVLWRGE